MPQNFIRELVHRFLFRQSRKIKSWLTKRLLMRSDGRIPSQSHKKDRSDAWEVYRENTARREQCPAQALLENGGLEVWYQPVLDGHSRRVVGIEALARLRDTEGGILTPERFLPQLSTDETTNLSRMVLIQALEDLKKLDALGWSLWVSFNVAPESFGSRSATCLQKVIGASGVAPQRITLEILEGGEFAEYATALSAMHDIKALGMRLALDDVGSAYASLLRLKNLPIDEIKLDQGFVRTLEERPQDLHFVRTMQELATELRLDLVVEGVETPSILDAMITTGVPYLQGYAISKPLPLAKLPSFLSNSAPDPGAYPNSLFGFYASVLAHHTAVKRLLLIDPSQVNHEVLKDGRRCRGNDVLHHLGYGEESRLIQLHNHYHRVFGVVASHGAIRHKAWDAVESALHELLEAILGAR